MEALHNFAHVVLDGAFGQTQRMANLFIGQPLGRETEDLLLARGEFGQGRGNGRYRWLLGKLLQNLLCQLRRKGRCAIRQALQQA